MYTETMSTSPEGADFHPLALIDPAATVDRWPDEEPRLHFGEDEDGPEEDDPARTDHPVPGGDKVVCGPDEDGPEEDDPARTDHPIPGGGADPGPDSPVVDEPTPNDRLSSGTGA